jgi:hypothetical protein
MNSVPWFERQLTFGKPVEMLPYYLERLEGTLPRIERKVIGIPNQVLSNKLDDKWSIKQNIGHLAEVDAVANIRIDEMLAGVEVMSPAVFEPQDYNPWPIEEVIALFAINRKANLAKYRQLAFADLSKASLHPRLKVSMTPVDLAWFDAEHDDHHLVRISIILNQLKEK